MPIMQTVEKYRWHIIGGLIIIVLVVVAVLSFSGTVKPSLPVDAPSEFKSANFSFSYPRLYVAKEYGTGSVSLGGTVGDSFIPLVDVVRYKSDPESAQPANFIAFANKQAQALCGSDAADISLTCTAPVVKPYATPDGLVGEELSLTVVHKNLKTGTTTTSTYAPIYAFNTTPPADAGEAIRYQGVFVYPDFSSFMLAPSSATLVADIAAGLTITSGTKELTPAAAAKQGSE